MYVGVQVSSGIERWNKNFFWNKNLGGVIFYWKSAQFHTNIKIRTAGNTDPIYNAPFT